MSDEIRVTTQMINSSTLAAVQIAELLNELVRSQWNAGCLHEILAKENGSYISAANLNDEQALSIAKRCDDMNMHYFFTDNGDMTKNIFINGNAGDVQNLIDEAVIAEKREVLHPTKNFLASCYPNVVKFQIEKDSFEEFHRAAKFNNLHFAMKREEDNTIVYINPKDKENIIRTIEETKMMCTDIRKKQRALSNANFNQKKIMFQELYKNKEDIVLVSAADPNTCYKYDIEKNNVSMFIHGIKTPLSKDDNEFLKDVGEKNFMERKIESMIDGGVLSGKEHKKSIEDQRDLILAQNQPNLLNEQEELQLNHEIEYQKRIRREMKRMELKEFSLMDAARNTIEKQALFHDLTVPDEDFYARFPDAGNFNDLFNESQIDMEHVDQKELEVSDLLSAIQLDMKQSLDEAIPGFEKRQEKRDISIQNDVMGLGDDK